MADKDSPSLARHASQCHLCKHPLCKEIEEKYLHWTSPYDLALEYPDVSRDSIDNHVRFMGLVEQRDVNFVDFYRKYMERGNQKGIPIDGHMALKASELYAKLLGKIQSGNNTTVSVGVQVTTTIEAKDKRIEESYNRFAHAGTDRDNSNN